MNFFTMHLYSLKIKLQHYLIKVTFDIKQIIINDIDLLTIILPSISAKIVKRVNIFI